MTLLAIPPGAGLRVHMPLAAEVPAAFSGALWQLKLHPPLCLDVALKRINTSTYIYI